MAMQMETGPIRRAAVAGQFYAASYEALIHDIEHCYLSSLGPGALPQVNEGGPRRIVGLVSPHAGFMYSGPTAARGYTELAADGRPQHIVIISPCHRPWVSAAAVIQTSGGWQTPLGVARIDRDAARQIASYSPRLLSDEPEAFAGEHSLEVQLPFCQHLYGDNVQFVPIMQVDQSYETSRRIAEAVAGAMAGQDLVIIASTDMTHYESPQSARRKDELLIERMLRLDARGLLELRAEHAISMCGAGPVATMLTAASALGATAARQIAYSHSGEVMPSREVVAYLSLKVLRG